MITMTCLMGVVVASSGDGFPSVAALAKGAAMANWNIARVASPRRKNCTPFETTDLRLIFPPVSALVRVAGWFGYGKNSPLEPALADQVLRESVPSFLHP